MCSCMCHCTVLHGMCSCTYHPMQYLCCWLQEAIAGAPLGVPVLLIGAQWCVGQGTHMLVCRICSLDTHSPARDAAWQTAGCVTSMAGTQMVAWHSCMAAGLRREGLRGGPVFLPWGWVEGRVIGRGCASVSGLAAGRRCFARCFGL